jgi:hypothetical protein
MHPLLSTSTPHLTPSYHPVPLGYDGFSDPQSSGFCVFNNVAAGALHALDEEGHGVQRVAIIDLDIHHGVCLINTMTFLHLAHTLRVNNPCLHLFTDSLF